MPELPEVETTRLSLQNSILNQNILNIKIYNRNLRWPITQEHLAIDKTITQLYRRGKYLILQLNSHYWIMIHLGMSGSLRVVSKDYPLKKHDHWCISLSNSTFLIYHDPRRFGCTFFGEGDWKLHPRLQKLGIEPLSAQFHGTYLYQHTKNKHTPIKQLIMNSSIVVGVGNIYANESIFCSALNPSTKSMHVDESQCHQLSQCIKDILKKAIKNGGSSIRNFSDAQENLGYFQQQLSVYGREGKSCVRPTCSGQIMRVILGQRSSFYCSDCQA